MSTTAVHGRAITSAAPVSSMPLPCRCRATAVPAFGSLPSGLEDSSSVGPRTHGCACVSSAYDSFALWINASLRAWLWSWGEPRCRSCCLTLISCGEPGARPQALLPVACRHIQPRCRCRLISLIKATSFVPPAVNISISNLHY